MISPGGRFFDELVAIVGSSHVLVDRDVIRTYETDWTTRFVGQALAVVRPGSTAAVSEVLTLCHREGQAVVTQGGNTGLVGGATPMDNALVLSTQRLTRLGAVDSVTAQITVGAGVTLSAVQEAARASGLDAPVDLGARSTATIGGMVATNAGGTRVVRHGMMRAHVHGLEAVLADGTVVSRIGGLLKDNTGYDWPRLLTGSEGTLAVITEVRLGLTPRMGERTVVVVGWNTLADAVCWVAALRQLGHLWSAEVVTASGCRFVAGQLGLSLPGVFTAPYALLVEIDGFAHAIDDVSATLSSGELELAVTEPFVAGPAEGQQGERLWQVRERHTEAINTLGPPVKLDVTLPLHRLDEFVSVLSNIRADAVIFGHVGDGNLHVNVPALGHPERQREAAAVEDQVLHAVAKLGGSISAEHGIGRAKRDLLHLSRSPAELVLFQSLKHALDPQGILNPGCLLPPPSDLG
jgi:FAD/FMN-containing dehydrogenase